MILGLVGEKLAGKDTVANYLVDHYKAAHFRFTHILDAILEELTLPISRKNEIDLGLGLRTIFGQHILVNALENRLKKNYADLKIVNGIRMDEFEVVKNWGAKIIYITAPIEIRYQRYLTRKEKTDDGIMSFEDFKAIELGPTEIAIPELGKKADFKIENVGNKKELYGKVEEIIKLF